VDIRNIAEKATLGSYWILACFLFMSISLSALSHILLIIALCSVLYLTILRKMRIDWSCFSRGSYAFTVMVALLLSSVLMNWKTFEHPVAAMLKVKYYIFGLIGILLLTTFSSLFKPEMIRRMINIFLITTSAATLSGIGAFFFGYNLLRFKVQMTDRPGGMYGMVLTYGYGIAIILVLAIAMLIKRKSLQNYFNQKLLIAFIAINTVGLLFSGCRGAILGFCYGVMALSVFYSKKLFAALFIGFTILAILIAVVLKEKNFKAHLVESATSSSTTLRLIQYKTALYAMAEYPFKGVGFRNFEARNNELKDRYHIFERRDFVGQAHNIFLEIGVGSGVVAMIAFCLWLGFWLRDSLIANHPALQIFFPFLVTYMISGLFESTITDGEILFSLMALYSIFETIKFKTRQT